MEKATFAGGCFWCLEAVFQQIKGIEQVTSGYSGGKKKNPTYEDVTSQLTGYAESVQVDLNPKEILYEELLDIFFRLHDPTTLNRQGPDIGSQYRSIIFYHSKKQKKVAQKARENAQKLYPNPIVTRIEQFKVFYKAENYHQNFYNTNLDLPYCRLIIDPKIQKLRKLVPERLK